MSSTTDTSDLAPPTPTKSSSRGISPVLAAVIIVIVLVVAGAGTFFALAPYSKASTSSHSVTCYPPTAPACTSGKVTVAHTGAVTSPFTSTQQGTSIPFTMTLPGNIVAKQYTFYTGDGSNVSGFVATQSYTYPNAGNYYVYGVAVTSSGAIYDNLGSLLHITVSSSFASDTLGNLAQAGGQVLANSTASSGATAILSAGQSVTLKGYPTSLPTNAIWSISNTSFAASSSSALTVTNEWARSVSGSYAIANVTVSATAAPGVYPVDFVVTTCVMQNVSGKVQCTGTPATTEYVFTVAVSASNFHAGPPAVTVATAPKPGTLNIYELAPAGAVSEDPAIDYETVGYEPILNVYGTLIRYNGSHAGPDPSDFVPMIATCVPGSQQCKDLYGNSLLNNGSYTFVINPNARFYDPNSKTATPVTASDVIFSVARTCLFSTYPAVAINPGWILCQSILPAGNPSWDGGLHFPYNNTPSNILNGVYEGGSYCPAGISADMCVTFNTTLSGAPWPEFLEFVADPLGASVMSCTWASAHGAGLPDWSTCSSVPSPTSVPDTAWDSYMLQGASNDFNTYIQWHLVGSGPYYVSNYVIGSSYELKANPDWAGTTCIGGTANGCLPGAFNATNPPYIPTVNVVWESTQTPGETALAAGTADSATIPPTDTSFLLQEVKSGVANAMIIPTLTVAFDSLDFQFNVAGAQGYISEKVTAPSNLLADYNFRHFLAAAMPYGTIESTIDTVDGIQYGFQSGGAIPDFMGNFYPTNISWPAGNPVNNPSVVGSAGYWWAQVQNESGAYAIAKNACTPTTPCTFPLMSQAGLPALDAENSLFVASVAKISNGAVNIIPVDIPLSSLVVNAFVFAGQNPMPMYDAFWVPDYPDPTDYVTPMYFQNSTFTEGDALQQAISNGTAEPQFNQVCAGPRSDPTVTYSCQGWAYNVMVGYLEEAASCQLPSCSASERVLLYNIAEKIANQLTLYLYTGQSNLVYDYANWINPAGINTNPMIGGGNDQSWYTWSYTTGSP